MNETEGPDRGQARRPASLVWRVIHWVIIANLLVEALYASYVIFFVLAPPGGGGGPLWGAAASIPHELMVTRRLYAIEAWIAMGALSIYLGITEIGPRLQGRRRGH